MLYVSATLLRRAGRRLADGETADMIEGELTVRARDGCLRAEIRTPLTMSSEPLAILYDVRLLGIDGSIWLRGYEQAIRAGVLQEWQCRIIDSSHGIDSITMRPAPCPARR